MNMILRIIDKTTGIFLRDDFTACERTEIALDVEPAQGLYLPKWDGEKWVESMTQAEIDAIQGKTSTPEPSLEERVEKLETIVL
jgi:hypothetical protein